VVSSQHRSRPRWIVVTHALLPNGAAHRLAGALREHGRDVGFCAIPMPGGVRTRAERRLPRSESFDSLIDRQGGVPVWREPLSIVDFMTFGRRVHAEGRDSVVVVACDPLAYLEAIPALRIGGVKVRSDAVWFVDWSAQRLNGRLSGRAYKSIARSAARRAKVVGAITSTAAGAIAELGHSRAREEILVLPNLPLSFDEDKTLAWDSRPKGVVYLGGLSSEHGAELLLRAALALTNAGHSVDIAGDGPAASDFAEAAARIDGLNFHGMINDPQELATIMYRSRVGLALYDPTFPMFAYNDSLKIKDYLRAGLRVVTTFPRGVEDDSLRYSSYDVETLVSTTLGALNDPPRSDPRNHPLIAEAVQPLLELIDRLEGTS
jgi:hypothetical protein